MSRYLSEGSDWDFELLARYDEAIADIAHNKYGLDTYPNQIEVISSEQMMDAYSSVGMPVGYNHWSFGKQFVEVEGRYRRGQMGLAYEIVINSDPCIAYLMEENSIAMQALVIAHASYGHNSFSRTITCSRPGLMPRPSLITWYSHETISQIAKCATASLPWRKPWIPAMR